MADPPDPRRGTLLAVMLLAATWTALLAIGFGYAVVTGAGRLGPVRTVVFLVLAVLMAMIAVRTALELWRRLRSR